MDKIDFLSGLFSFKNYQLMSVTESLFRRSGRVYETRLFIVPCRVSQALPDLQYVMTICQLEMV